MHSYGCYGLFSNSATQPINPPDLRKKPRRSVIQTLCVREYPVPLAISAVAFVVFTALLWLGRIGEASYCFLVAASVLLGLVLHGFGRLQELDLKNLRLVLREIEQTKKELFVREEKLKAIAVPLAQVIAFTGASEGRIGTKESWAIKRQWYRQKVEALVNALELSSSEAVEIQKFADKYGEIDGTMGKLDGLNTTDPDYMEVKERREKLSGQILEMMRADLEK